MVPAVLVWAASRVFDILVQSRLSSEIPQGKWNLPEPSGRGHRVGLVGVNGTSSQVRAQSTGCQGFPQREGRDSLRLTAASSSSKLMPENSRRTKRHVFKSSRGALRPCTPTSSSGLGARCHPATPCGEKGHLARSWSRDRGAGTPGSRLLPGAGHSGSRWTCMCSCFGRTGPPTLSQDTITSPPTPLLEQVAQGLRKARLAFLQNLLDTRPSGRFCSGSRCRMLLLDDMEMV